MRLREKRVVVIEWVVLLGQGSCEIGYLVEGESQNTKVASNECHERQ